MSLDDRVAQQQANGAPVLPSVTPQKNPAGFQYVPNVNGQYVPAPPGHPAHSGVPAGYQYPPGGVEIATGVVEVPRHEEEDDAEQVRAFGPMNLPPSAPEKPKRTRRTRAEIEAEKATQAPVTFSQTSHTPSPEEIDETLAANPLPEEYKHLSPMSAPGAHTDTALEILAARSLQLKCEIQVNIRFGGEK